ncbi:MAG: S-layer homology domain-containing protein, partial [Clostridiales bacterium]|nr:S-layer homology domain-containing protein [Clostridiales bacterium]
MVLAVMFVVTTAAVSVSAGADESAWYIKAVRYLDNLTISDIGAKGDEPVSRDEFVTWVSKIESHQLVEEAWNVHRYVTAATSVFTDVEDSDHKGAIGYAVNRGFIEGYGDKTFGPHNTVKLGEASAIIVRMMGYQDFVEEGDEWAYNNMYVANSFCHAFDDMFLTKTGTYDPDYELTKGEAAWLLYTIMNGDHFCYGADYDDIKNPEALTSKDINLGAWFGATKTFSYDVIVAKADYALTATAGVSYRRYDAIVAGGFNYNKVDSLPRTNGWVKADGKVTLAVVGTSDKFTVSGKDFAKFLGVTDATANVLETAEVGSMIRITSTKAIDTATTLTYDGFKSTVKFTALDKLASDSYI